MKIIFMGANTQERVYIEDWSISHQQPVTVVTENLTSENIDLTKGFDGLCFYPSPELATNEMIYHQLKENGIKVLSVKSTGVDGINFEFARKYDLTVTNVPAYSPTSVGHFAIMLILMLLRHVPDYLGESTRKSYMGRELSDVTIGILGTGRIGSLVAKNLIAMGANVIAYGKDEDPVLAKKISYVSFEELLKLSDVISIHIPATAENYHMFSQAVFKQMKPNAILINTARGSIVDTQAMIPFLENGHLGGFGTDAIEHEEKYFATGWRGNPLVKKMQELSNVIITPHIAYFTELAVRQIVETSLENALAIIKDEYSVNVVS